MLSLPQMAPPALPQGQGEEALLRGPPLDGTTAVPQKGAPRRGRGQSGPDKLRSGGQNRSLQAPRPGHHGLRPCRPADRTALASTKAAVIKGLLAAWQVCLLPHVPCRRARLRPPAAIHAPTAPHTAKQLYTAAAALLADSGESFVHHHGLAHIMGSSQGPQSVTAPASGTGTAEHPLLDRSRGSRW